MKLLQLGGRHSDKSVMIDDDLYDYLSNWKWQLLGCGYVGRSTRIKGVPKTILLHRLIAEAKDGECVDHKDLNRLNCTRENLRIVTHAQNNYNRGATKNSSSKYKGITYAKGKWQSSVKFKGKSYYLGRFETEEDAALAYNKKAKELFGEFAYQNAI